MASNLPPDDINPLAERLSDDYRGMAERTAELVAALARAPAVVDEANFDRSGAFVRQLREHAKLLEATRVQEKDPYLQSERTIDGFFKRMLTQLDEATKAMNTRIGVFLKAKERAEREARKAEAQRQREEQERLAAEAQRLLLAALDVQQIRTPEVEEQDLAAAIAADEELKRQQEVTRAAERAALASAADLARTRSAIAGTATLLSDLDWEVTDHRRAVQILADYITADALDHAINAYKRTYKGEDNRDRIIKTQPVAGVRFFPKQQARVV